MKKNLLKEQYARLFKGRVSSNDAKLIKEEAEIMVSDHDDMREEDDEGIGMFGEIEYKGIYDGFNWTATQEFLPDGAVFTSVYDAAGENMEDENIDAYDEINDAIGEYMEKEGIESE